MGCDEFRLKFELDKPAIQFELLLYIYQKQSICAILYCYRHLYESGNKSLDFYPSLVKLDINEARYVWISINEISFIELAYLQRIFARVDQGCSLQLSRSKAQQTYRKY